MSGPGYGRGGRGAALLAAFQQPQRRPGESDSPPEKQSPPPSAAPTPTLGLGRGLGRGAYNQSLLQALKQTSVAPVAAVASVPAAPAAPRDIAQSGIGRAAPLGRGRGLLFHASMLSPQTTTPESSSGVVTPRPVAAVQPSGSTSPGSLSDDFSKLMVQEENVMHCVGTSGKQIPLRANHIRLKSLNPAIYQYQIYFTPQIDSKGMRFRLLYTHTDVIGEVRAFDGNILYLPKKLPHIETVLHSVRPTDNVNIKVLVKLVKIIPPASELCMPVYNTIFKRMMSTLSLYQVGRHHYDPKRPQSVPQHKLEIWPGYITAIKEHEGGLMLLADVHHRVLRTTTVLDVIADIANKSRGNSFRDEVMKAIVGSTVLTRYNNKTYMVHDIAWDLSPASTFSTKSGEISYCDYYKKNYNKQITDMRQPLLIHIPKQPKDNSHGTVKRLEQICLIPEFSYSTGLTDEMRKDFRIMKDIATHTRVTPERREFALKKFIDNVSSTPEASKMLTDWGLELSTETVTVPGRLLNPEDILFGNTSVSAGPQADWGRSLSHKVITPVHLENWIIIYYRRDNQRANNFVQMYMKQAPRMGIRVKNPMMIELPDDKTESYIRKMREQINPRVQCIVTIFPTNRDDRYNAVKKLATVECPIASQVIISKTIGDERKLGSVVQKIALQINCKLGGELWAVNIPVKNMMIIGIDVYHDKSGQHSSWLGFVASMNQSFTSWYSKVSQQLPGQELGDKLKLCMVASLRKYHSIHGELPSRIMIYRDGVGDGRLKMTADYEARQLEESFASFGDNYRPKMGFVVVSKRINTRLFAEINRKLDNPPPGTIADDVITRRQMYDFFLVSQHVRQGTVSPTHYIVIYDNSGMLTDHIQKLTYKLTHLYYNWPGTVRVPAPCQYAHKLAYLVGQNTHKEHAEELSNRLFFL
ncbi:piwi-like protein 1 isoform X2 [Tubulanus polymorphus]|uniref:piwi-like protein 1 isoform X2 n=1 Tax=Tubulanus polymorphus TaxID=672921 RepID=UPI003DA2DFA6